MRLSSIQLALALNGLALVSASGGEALPKALSDMTATLVGDKVYIAGGCDAILGNVYNNATGFFDCLSISNSFYAFDIKTEKFEILADLPVDRWRHAAAAANNKLYLHGGRQVDGYTSIPQVDVYDIASGTWSVYTGFDDKYNISDHTGFSHRNFVYFAGGYWEDYETLAMLFRINATATTPVIQDMSSMNVPRGDIAASVTGDYAIVAGGFTDDNNWCAPHKSAERYWFTNNTWMNITDMVFGGAERVLVDLTTGVYAIGGESVPETNSEDGDCTNSIVDPGEKATTLDKMERYDLATDTWTTLDDLPDHRFRFAAVGQGNKIYTFGGQLKFNETCNCHRTTNLVIIYTENGDGSVAERVLGGDSSAFKRSAFIALVSSVAAIFMVLA